MYLYEAFIKLNIIDQFGCEIITIEYEVTQPEILAVTFVNTASDLDLECSNSLGNITVLATGGTEPYTFDWDVIENQLDDQGNLISEGISLNNPDVGVNNSIEGIGGGTYNVTVIDATGECNDNIEPIVIDPPATSISASVLASSFTVLDCTGDSNGTIEVEVEGGEPPYNFRWADIEGNLIPDVSQYINDEGNTVSYVENLTVGSYELNFIDNAGCSYNELPIIEITEPAEELYIEILETSETDFNGFWISCYEGNEHRSWEMTESLNMINRNLHKRIKHKNNY